MATVFPQLAAAEPSCPGVHGLGVMSAMPLATRIPLTLTSLLREGAVGAGPREGLRLRSPMTPGFLPVLPALMD